MPPEERDPAYLWDMLEAAHEVQRFMAAVRLEEYMQDPMRQRAIERTIEILGEMDSDFHAHGVSLPWPSFLPSRLTPQRYYTPQRSKEQEQVVRRIGEAGIGSVRLLLSQPAQAEWPRQFLPHGHDGRHALTQLRQARLALALHGPRPARWTSGGERSMVQPGNRTRHRPSLLCSGGYRGKRPLRGAPTTPE
jgi:hypothetical protein